MRAPLHTCAMEVHVRIAVPGDAAVLARLRYEFRASIGDAVEPETLFLQRCVPWMEERLCPGSAWTCWVAETRGGVAGNLWLQVIEKLPNPGPELEAHAYITSVYVRPAARGTRVGEKLLAAAMDWCRAHEIDSAILWPTARSRTLYARAGFSVAGDIMEAVIHPGRALDHG